MITEKTLESDTWLDVLTAPESEQPRLWHHRWRHHPMALRGQEQLTVQLASLRPDGDFAGVTDEASGRWAQVKRIDSGWWVEGSGPDDEWPWVFVPEAWVGDQGDHGLEGHACWSHHTAAEIVWAWLDGRTPTGARRIPAP